MAAVAPVFPLDVEAQENKAVIDVGDQGLLGREGHLELAGQQRADLVSDRIGVGPGAMHQHQEIVGLCRGPDYAEDRFMGQACSENQTWVRSARRSPLATSPSGSRACLPRDRAMDSAFAEAAGAR